MEKTGKNRALVDESELLVTQLKKHPIMAKLVDYALAQGIIFLINPQSEEMIKNGTAVWGFCVFSLFSKRDFFIFVPFDMKKSVILPESEAHQIWCLAHELGHFKLKDSRFKCANEMNCPIWISRFNKNWQDNCLLKEILTNLQAVRIMKTVARTAMRNHAWKIILLNLWLQCSFCLEAIKDGACPLRGFIGRAFRALAKAVNSAQKEIAAQLERQKIAE